MITSVWKKKSDKELAKLREKADFNQDEKKKEDRNRIISQKLKKITELAKIKLSLEEKDIQIEHLDTRLKESTKLLGSNLEAIKCQIQSNSKSPDVSKPSTSYQTRNSITLPNNDNMFDDIIRNLQELLESQLQCSICNEVRGYLKKTNYDSTPILFTV